MKSLVNKKFGRLKVLSYKGRNKQYDSLWECVCDCGKTKTVRSGALKSGHTKSCGCFRSEMVSKSRTTHGLINDNYKLYKVWIGIKQRCFNPKNKSFIDYGGRGIKICEEWKLSFESFHNWSISNGYSEGLSIDRVDNDGNYELSNCRWTTKKFQSRNRRNCVKIKYENKSLTASEWSDITGIPSKVLTQRIRRGWTPEKTITTKL